MTGTLNCNKSWNNLEDQDQRDHIGIPRLSGYNIWSRSVPCAIISVDGMWTINNNIQSRERTIWLWPQGGSMYHTYNWYFPIGSHWPNIQISLQAFYCKNLYSTLRSFFVCHVCFMSLLPQWYYNNKPQAFPLHYIFPAILVGLLSLQITKISRFVPVSVGNLC